MCCQNDAIQRLPAVVLGGRQAGSYSGAIENGTSELARYLSAPPEPVYRGGLSLWTWLGVAGFFAFWPVMFLAINSYYFSSVRDPEASPTRLVEYFEVFLRLGLPISIVILILVLGLLSLYHFTTKNKGKTRYQADKPAWDEAIRRWNLTYYCHRDGILFAAETDKVTAPQLIDQFLYSEW